MAVEVTLVGEARGDGGVSDRLAGLKQAARDLDAMRDLQRMWRQAGALAEEADEAELPDPRGGGELIESHVPLGLVGEIVEGEAERALVTGGDLWAGRADGR